MKHHHHFRAAPLRSAERFGIRLAVIAALGENSPPLKICFSLCPGARFSGPVL